MNYFKRNYGLIFSVFFYIFFPLFFINNLWDGVIYDHLLEENDFNSLKRNFNELRYETFYFIHILIKFFNTNIGIPLYLIQDFLISLTLYLIFLEICKISNIFIYLRINFFKIGLIFFSIPFWHSLTSFPNFINIFLIFLSLIGFRFYLNKNLIINIFGIIILVLSFNLKSTITLIIGISLFYFYIDKFFKLKNSIPRVKFYLIMIFSILMILFYFKFSLPYGEYEGHNSLKITEIKINDLILNIFKFVNYFIFFLIFLIFFLRNKNKEKILYLITFLFFIYILVISPYILINKTPNIFTFSSFEGRHGFTFAIIFMMTCIFILNQIEKNKILQNIILLVIIFNTSILSLGYLAKYEHSLFSDSILKKVKKIQEPKKGEVILNFIDDQPAHLGFYELNYIFKKAFNKNNWLVTNHARDFSLERKAKKEYFKRKYVMNNYKRNCSTSLYLKGLTNIKDRILFLIFPEKYFQIFKIEEKC